MAITTWIVAPSTDSAAARAATENLGQDTWRRITSARSLPQDAEGRLLFSTDWRDSWPESDSPTGDPTAENGPGPLLAKAHGIATLDVEVVV